LFLILSSLVFTFLCTTYNHHHDYLKHICCENVWVSILKEQVNQIGNNNNNTKMKCVPCASSWSSSFGVIVITCCITAPSCRYYYYMFNIILLKEFTLLRLLKAFLNEESAEIDYLVFCCLTWNKKSLIQDVIIIIFSISIHFFIHSWTHLSININISSSLFVFWFKISCG